MSEDAVKPASRNIPFASSQSTPNGALGDGPRVSSGSIMFAATKPQATMTTGAAGRQAHSSSFGAASDTDPYALLYSNPAHAPPSLAQRAYGTETLFQYYAQRGYKEILMQPDDANAETAVQTCLEGKADLRSEAAAKAAAGETQKPFGVKKKTQPKNTHVIDRCLADASPGVIGTLRPPRAQDRNSAYLAQQADDERAEVKARRRAHLHQPPTETTYRGRYYPAGIDVLPRVPGSAMDKTVATASAAAAGGGAGAGSPTGLHTHLTASGSLSHSAAVETNAARTPASFPAPHAGNGGSRLSGSVRLQGGATGRTPSLVALLRTPEEIAAQVGQQREARHLLAKEIEDVFVAAYQLRSPAAAHRSSQATAELLAGTEAKKRVSTAASRGEEGKGKRKSTIRGTSGRPATAAVAVEGGFPANLTLFRSSLLLINNEDNAVSLDQLCAMAADVPFNIPTTITSATGSGNAVVHLFRVLHANTRAPNAPDATDLLIAMASAAAPGGAAGRMAVALNDNSISYGASTATGGGGGNNTVNAASRTGPASLPGGNARRLVGASVSSAAATGVNQGRGQRLSAQSGSRGTTTSPVGASLHPPATSVSFASNAHNTKSSPPGTSGAWKEMSGPIGSASRHQAGSTSAELKDSRKCVLVVEVLDAMDALLNSPETRNVVRWECFAVLANEGHGYIHKSQLVLLRRHAYRDGSVSEANALVTASMVRALEDAFALVAAEEEAAYLKANKKGRKGGGGAAGANLNSNQKSAIPLTMMRRSHMDFALFCRFFDELPQMPAAFAHVWLPLLMDGERQQSAMATHEGDDEDENEAASSVKSALQLDTSLAGDADAAKSGGGSDGIDFTESGNPNARRSVGRRSPRPSTKSAMVPEDEREEGFPLELLGSTPPARQAVVQRLLTKRLELLQEAWDALERQKLQDEPSTGSGAFSVQDTAPPP